MKRKIFNLWVLVAAAALVFATSCESDELDYVKEKPGTGDTETPIDPPTISFNGRIAIDESGEWPVASVEVNVSEDADYWYWMFEETRAYAEWTQKSPAKTKIEFPVLRTGDYTLSIKAENKGGESEIATDTFDIEIPEKYGDVFAAIDWELNEEHTAVTFNIQTTDATENWYWEFVKEEDATTFDGEITEIPASFTKGEKNEFTIDEFEQDTKYKMTVIAENAGGRKATSAKVSYFADSNSGNYEGPTHPAYIKLDVKPLSITRTEFDGDGIIWKDGDKFGILTATAAGEVLQNIGAYKSDEPYLMELADDAAFIYGYYPYDSELDAETINIKNFTFDFSKTNQNPYIYTSADDKSSVSGLYPLIAKGIEITEEEREGFEELEETPVYDMEFEPANATLVIVNIYGATEAESIKEFWFDTQESHGGLKINLTTGETTTGFGTFNTNGVYSTPQLINVDEDNAVKAYFIAAKGTYTAYEPQYDWEEPSPDFVIITDNGSYTYLFDGKDITLDQNIQEFSINIADLEEEAEPEALAEFVAFDDGEYILAPSLYSTTVKLHVPDASKIEWLAVAALPSKTTYDTNTDGSQSARIYGYDYKQPINGSGSDEAVEHGYFINQALTSYEYFEQGESLAQYYMIPYWVYIGTSISDALDGENNLIIENDKLLFNGRVIDGDYVPGKMPSFEPGTEYTVAVYIKYAQGAGLDGQYPEHYIIEPATFTPSALALESSQTITISEPEATSSSASATVTATGIEKIAAFYITMDDTENTENYIKESAIRNTIDSNTRFVAYTDPITLTCDDLRQGQKCVFVAVGIDEDGKMTKVFSKEATPTEITYADNAKITHVEVIKQTDTEKIKFKITTEGASAIRYANYLKTTWLEEDDRGSRTMTFEKVNNWFKIPNRRDYYTEVATTGNETEIEMWVATSPKPKASWDADNDNVVGQDNEFWRNDGDEDDPNWVYLGGDENLIIFCPVAEGSDGGELGHIQQLKGDFEDNTLYDATAAGNVDEEKYYTTAKEADLGEGEGGGEVEEDIWTSQTSFGFSAWAYAASSEVCFYASQVYASLYGKVWIINAGKDEELAELFSDTYSNSATIRAKALEKLQPLVANYATEKKISDSANIIKEYEAGKFPTTYGSEERASLVPEIGDIYIVIAEDKAQSLSDGTPKLFAGYFGVYNQNNSGTAKLPTAAVLKL